MITVLVDVDTQSDFMDPHGALYVPGAERLLPNLAALVTAARALGWAHWASLDTHTPDDPEFAAYGFPPHCVSGTPGWDKVPATRLDRVQAFQKASFDVFGNPDFATTLVHLAPERAVVCGVATDYCVKAAVLGLLARGIAVWLVEDAIAAVAEESGQAALATMVQAGARLVRTADVLALAHEPGARDVA